MNKENYSVRKAELKDLRKIIELYAEQDELSQARENLSPELDQAYLKAFERINQDPNQYLMLVENSSEIIGTCQLTLMPSLTLKGALRLNIEGVRVAEKYRGQKIGEWMINQAIQYGKKHGAFLVQLTTNKQRLKAKNFYEKLGFVASHEGMKLDLNLKIKK